MSAPPPTAANLNLLEATFLLGIGQEGKLASGYEKYLRIAAILQMIIMGKTSVVAQGDNAVLHINEQPTPNGADPIVDEVIAAFSNKPKYWTVTEWMRKLTGGIVFNSNSVKDLDDKVAASLEAKGVLRIDKGMLGSSYIVLDNNAAGNFLINLVYGVVDGIYGDEYSIALLCIARCLDPHFYAFFGTRDQQNNAMAVSRSLFQSRTAHEVLCRAYGYNTTRQGWTWFFIPRLPPRPPKI